MTGPGQATAMPNWFSRHRLLTLIAAAFVIFQVANAGYLLVSVETWNAGKSAPLPENKGRTKHLGGERGRPSGTSSGTSQGSKQTLTGPGTNREPAVSGLAGSSDGSGSSGTIYPVPPSINAACGADVTTAFGAWLKQMPDGTPSNPSIAQFASGGCYR